MTTSITKQQLTTKIKELAKEENISFLDACSAMQGAAHKMNNDSEAVIELIFEIKNESDDYKKLFS